MAKALAKALAKSAASQVQPKIFMRGDREFRHDLFKLEVASLTKNIGWKTYEPQLVTVEHCHFFHSHSSRGKPETHCQPIGGHFHRVCAHVGTTGDMEATVGPALHRVRKRTKAGKYRTVTEKVKHWHISVNDGEGAYVDDGHTHKAVYLGSEHLSPNKVKQIQTANKEFIGQTVSMQQDTTKITGEGEAEKLA